MNRIWFLASVAALLAAAPLQAASDGMVVITGSHIPQKVKRVGRQSGGITPVLILDREYIGRTGASTVAGVLRKIPFAQVRSW
jgi:hypothetical protein